MIPSRARILQPLGQMTLLLGRSVRRWPGDADNVWLQAYEVCWGSAFFVASTMAFVGGILVLQACSQAKQILGDTSPIGPAFLQLLVGEFGPVVVALLLAARYGAGVAAELAAMAVTEQVDALRMAGSDPVDYLVAPRVWGGLLGCIPITVFGTAMAYGSGALVAFYGFGIGWDTFLSHRMTTLHDVAVALCKTVSFGAAVPLVAAQAGLAAQGGAPGVGSATTRAVIGGSVALLALDFFVGLLGYLL